MFPRVMALRGRPQNSGRRCNKNIWAQFLARNASGPLYIAKSINRNTALLPAQKRGFMHAEFGRKAFKAAFFSLAIRAKGGARFCHVAISCILRNRLQDRKSTR